MQVLHESVHNRNTVQTITASLIRKDVINRFSMGRGFLIYAHNAGIRIIYTCWIDIIIIESKTLYYSVLK